MIEVRLFATLREGRDKIYQLEDSQAETVGGIIEYFAIPVEDVAIMLVNGRHRQPDYPVQGGDVIALFPPVGGG